MNESRARILFVNHVARLGGAECSLLDLVRHLDPQRYELHAALPARGELPELLRQAGVRVHTLPLRRLRKTANPAVLAGNALNVAWVSRRLAALIRRESIALVHANSTTAHLYAGPAAGRCGVPAVWHCRDLVSLGRLGPKLFRQASRVIAIADCVRLHLAPYVDDPAKLRTVRHGIDPSFCAAPDAAVRVRAQLGIPAGTRVVGMAGQMVPWKRHRTFLVMAARIARELPGTRFVVAGADLFNEHPDYTQELRGLVDELGLAESVTFTGHRSDMADLLASLDVVVHPAVREPLGRVLLEAMAVGRPVVAVNACGPAEIIRNGIDGVLTDSDSPWELADAVLHLLHEPALAARLGEAGRTRVAEHFSATATARQIEAVYAELLPPGGGPRSELHARGD